MGILLESYAKTLVILCYYYWKAKEFDANFIWNTLQLSMKTKWKQNDEYLNRNIKWLGISHELYKKYATIINEY